MLLFMDESYNSQKIEQKVLELWNTANFFNQTPSNSKPNIGLFLTPPNASGAMHTGNALMIAIQDIIARYYRSQGSPTVWIPGTDHGGYETEITFEKEFEKQGFKKDTFSKREIFNKIHDFVHSNNKLIYNQIKRLGASVDWTKVRFTMDDDFSKKTQDVFKKMVSENLISKKNVMNHFCPVCSTTLSDIELKEQKGANQYFIKFDLMDSENEQVTLLVKRPEFLFSVSKVLVHPSDSIHSYLIGKKLRNPLTKEEIQVIESERKHDPDNTSPLTPFCDSFVKYDYEYALMRNIPVFGKNLIDLKGKMNFRHIGDSTQIAREKDLSILKAEGRLVDTIFSENENIFVCKKGHETETYLTMTWILDLDHPNRSLKKEALLALEENPLNVVPSWRKREIIKYIDLMRAWPIARQNVWGISIPVWYDISSPSDFEVWFEDKNREKHNGNLEELLRKYSLSEISEGLEKIYTSKENNWVFEKENGKEYLPETDVFDTWFSSVWWGIFVFENISSFTKDDFYPAQTTVTGSDLIRLSISRKIVLGYYLTRKIPFSNICFNPIINGPDGNKMSKSYGNVIPLESYLDKYGTDITRLSLVSYTREGKDFSIELETLQNYSRFMDILWKMGKIADIAKKFAPNFNKAICVDKYCKKVMEDTAALEENVGNKIKSFNLAYAQELVTGFVLDLEEFANSIQTSSTKEEYLSVFKYVFEKYLFILHPFAPFVTEYIYNSIYTKETPLALQAKVEAI